MRVYFHSLARTQRKHSTIKAESVDHQIWHSSFFIIFRFFFNVVVIVATAVCGDQLPRKKSPFIVRLKKHERMNKKDEFRNSFYITH